MENRKIRRKNHEKSSPQYESEKANKVNNELKLNIDKQQDDKNIQKNIVMKRLCVLPVIKNLQQMMG